MEGLSLITQKSRVNEVFRKHPETFRVFIKYDIPACCPLDTIEVEAKKRGIDPEKLVEELNNLLRRK